MSSRSSSSPTDWAVDLPRPSSAFSYDDYNPRPTTQMPPASHPVEDNLFSEIGKVMAAWDEPPIEPMLTEIQTNMAVTRMINILLEAETALRVSDPDTAEDRIAAGLEIAVETGDGEYVQRCRELLGMVENLRDSLEVNEREQRGKEMEQHESDQNHRDGIPAELLGEFLERHGDGEWNYDDCEEDDDDDNGFDPCSRPETPALPSPTDDEREETKQPEQVLDEPTSERSWTYASSGNEDHIDSDDVSDISDNVLSDISDESQPIRLTENGKRPLSPIARTALSYSHIQRPKKLRTRKASKAKPSEQSLVNNVQPKPWHLSSENIDLPIYPHSYCNTHAPTMLLRQDIPHWDMAWLPAYEASPVVFQKAAFTFRQHLSMTEIASRFRTTKIFSEQEWEFIPRRRQWNKFVRGCQEEKLTLGFLRWERERLQGLVDEKREVKKKGWMTRLMVWTNWAEAGTWVALVFVLWLLGEVLYGWLQYESPDYLLG